MRLTLAALVCICATVVIALAPAEAADVRRRTYWPTADWRELRPERAGFDPATLKRLDRHVETALPHIRSVLVARGGSIVFERYYQGTDRETLHDVASVTKSVTSIVVGIAIAQGLLPGVGVPIGTLLPECSEPRLGRVTLEHLLTMTSGFAFPNTRVEAPVRDACARGLATEPGAVFAYDSASSHIALAAAAAAARTDARTFAGTHLFRPLGITDLRWPTDAEGRPYGGGGLSMRTRDLAKLAFLYLNEGRWEGRALVRPEWVRESTRAHSPGGFPEGVAYGLSWWVARNGRNAAFFAGGFGGQFLYVIPGLDLLVVITSSLDRPHIENRGIVGDYVIPALVRPRP
jgi:CubicO group peptidase (beta-lactamase class C family)